VHRGREDIFAYLRNLSWKKIATKENSGIHRFHKVHACRILRSPILGGIVVSYATTDLRPMFIYKNLTLRPLVEELRAYTLSLADLHQLILRWIPIEDERKNSGQR
jgi:hypothetical protein